jgi:3-methyladenine DNA glycosylase Tag
VLAAPRQATPKNRFLTMKSFAALYDRAAKRKGGAQALEALLPMPLTKAKLAKIPDDRWLSMMSKCVFQAGFNWQVVENKWPDIEEAFAGFHPKRWTFMSDDDFDRLLRDKRIIRHATKILAVRDNATFLCGLAEEHGSAARFFAEWPAEDYVGLLLLLKKRAARLGGNSAQYFLRAMGKDSFILSRDVVAALLREGVVNTDPKSQRDLKLVQAAFNHWLQECGRPLTQISKVLAFTVGA